MSDSNGEVSDTFVDVKDSSGVGLSDPKFASWRRKMLDVANKLHNTGYVLDRRGPPSILTCMAIKGTVLYGPTNDYGDRVSECGEVLADRVFLWCHPPKGQRHLHEVVVTEAFSSLPC